MENSHRIHFKQRCYMANPLEGLSEKIEKDLDEVKGLLLEDCV